MRKTFYLSLAILFSFQAFTQNVEITPGSIIPKIHSYERSKYDLSQDGIFVFDIDSKSFWYTKNNSWIELLPAESGFFTIDGVDGYGGRKIKFTETGGFWSPGKNGLQSYSDNISNPPTAPESGDGTRLMWIPSRSAFRVGTVADGTQYWDPMNIGLFSFASGFNVLAKGRFSVALGTHVQATENSSVAIGVYSTADAPTAVALGALNNASGYSAVAMGGFSNALGRGAASIGIYNEAAGDTSLALGSFSKAIGLHSKTIGKAIQLDSSAIGSIYLADASRNGEEEIDRQSESNKFYARFDGGYEFYTDGTGSLKAFLAPGKTAWDTPSDSTLKENFVAANTEDVLNSVSQMRIGTWNYKGQDPTNFRHWGVMAQDFYKHFGRDEYGTIGDDKSISTADFDGVAFAAIKGLEQRTRDLSDALQQAESDRGKLKMKNEQQEDIINKLIAENQKLKEKQEFFASEISLIRQQLGLKSPEVRESE